MAKTQTELKTATGIVSEQSAINLNPPMPVSDLTETEAATLAHEAEAILKEASEILLDPGEKEMPFPVAEDVVIPFEKINDLMAKSEPADSGMKKTAQEASPQAQEEKAKQG